MNNLTPESVRNKRKIFEEEKRVKREEDSRKKREKEEKREESRKEYAEKQKEVYDTNTEAMCEFLSDSLAKYNKTYVIPTYYVCDYVDYERFLRLVKSKQNRHIDRYEPRNHLFHCIGASQWRGKIVAKMKNDYTIIKTSGATEEHFPDDYGDPGPFWIIYTVYVILPKSDNPIITL